MKHAGKKDGGAHVHLWDTDTVFYLDVLLLTKDKYDVIKRRGQKVLSKILYEETLKIVSQVPLWLDYCVGVSWSWITVDFNSLKLFVSTKQVRRRV